MITTVVVAARLRLYQELLAAIVGSRAGFAVLAVSGSEAEAGERLRCLRPDIALIDAGVPGVWAIAETARHCSTRVVVFGVTNRPEPLEAAERAGCDAVLTCSATSRQVIESLERVRSCETHPLDSAVDCGPVGNLTSREFEVLALVARGLSNKEIARELTVSLPTVKTHVHNVLAKLGARRRADAGRLLHFAASAGETGSTVDVRLRLGAEGHPGSQMTAVAPDRASAVAVIRTEGS